MGIPAQWERPSPASCMISPSIGLHPTITRVGLEEPGQHDYARLKPIQRHDQSRHTSMFSDADSLTFHGAPSLTNVSGDYIVQVSESSRPAIPNIPLREEQKASESVSERYARIHFPMRNGYAIWYPQPMTSAPQEYREDGIRFGDVVLVSSSGQTDFLFNIMVGKDDPVNRRGVPDGFVPISPPAGGWEVNTNEDYFTPGKNVLSGSVEMTAHQGGIDPSDPVKYTFRCRPREGAILALPEGAIQEDLVNHGSFYTYAAKHAMEWYQYVNQRRDRAASNGSLYLVTGHDKTHVWGTASFSSALTPDGFPLSYGSTDPSQQRRKYSHAWTQSGSASTLAGPALPNCDDEGNRRRNQCVFIRGYKITLAETIWQKLFVGRVTVEHTRESSYNDTLVPFRDSETPGWTSYLSPNTWTRHGGTSNGGQRRNNGQVQSTAPSVSPIVPQFSRSLHPSNVINQWLLDQDPGATCSITHDSVWCSAIEGFDSVPDASTLIELVERKYYIKARSGSLTVEEKPCSSGENDHEVVFASEAQQTLATATSCRSNFSQKILDSPDLNSSTIPSSKHPAPPSQSPTFLGPFSERSSSHPPPLENVPPKQGRRGGLLSLRDISDRRGPSRLTSSTGEKTAGRKKRTIKIDRGIDATETFKVQYEQRERVVCVKVITVNTSDPREVVKAYSRETILWRQLCHKNIPPFFGVSEINKRPCLVSPWMENGNVVKYLERNPDADRMKLILDLTMGLRYLQQQKIVHGDLKGVHTLITKDGTARLADFGLSSISDASIPSWTTQSSLASRGGSLRWMAPESFVADMVPRNTKEGNVYSWGCTCYEIGSSSSTRPRGGGIVWNSFPRPSEGSMGVAHEETSLCLKEYHSSQQRLSSELNYDSDWWRLRLCSYPWLQGLSVPPRWGHPPCPLQVNNRAGLSSLEQCIQNSWGKYELGSLSGRWQGREIILSSFKKIFACRESDQQREATRALSLEAPLWKPVSDEDARCEVCKTGDVPLDAQYAIVGQWTSQENEMIQINHFESNQFIKLFDITRGPSLEEQLRLFVLQDNENPGQNVYLPNSEVCIPRFGAVTSVFDLRLRSGSDMALDKP